LVTVEVLVVRSGSWESRVGKVRLERFVLWCLFVCL
jgi:hypothetical protein